VLIFATSLVNAEELGPYIGFYKGKGGSAEYHLTFNFGIEQWENNKQSTNQYQKWFLRASFPQPATKKRTTRCSLERLVITMWPETSLGTVISQHNHYQEDGTLKLQRVDWEKGILDFSIALADLSTIEIALRMGLKNDRIYLKSFNAIGIARGMFSDTMTAIEYKIPKYTYTLDVPVKMTGLRSENDKKWDDMIGTLSEEDQIAWEKSKAEGAKCVDKEFDGNLKKIIPDSETRETDLTLEEKAKLEAAFFEQFNKCLSKSSISRDGQAKIANEIKRTLRESFK